MTSARLRAATGALALAPVLVAAPASSAAAVPQGAADTTRRPGAILVQVTDTSINPLPAEILVPALDLGVRLNEEGLLLLVNVPAGVYLVQARQAGYAAESRLVRVTRDTIRIELVLAPTSDDRERRAAGSGGGVAQARLLYFLSRSGSIPNGSFLTKTEIKRRRARTLSALLRRVRDISVVRMDSGWIAVRSREAPATGCAAGMLVFIDAVQLLAPGAPSGQPVAASGEEAPGEPTRRVSWQLVAGGGTGQQTTPRQALRWVGPTARDLVRVIMGPSDSLAARANIDRVPIASVVAVEVYPTLAAAPPEFRMPGAECGVLLVWTAG